MRLVLKYQDEPKVDGCSHSLRLEHNIGCKPAGTVDTRSKYFEDTLVAHSNCPAMPHAACVSAKLAALISFQLHACSSRRFSSSVLGHAPVFPGHGILPPSTCRCLSSLGLAGTTTIHDAKARASFCTAAAAPHYILPAHLELAFPD
jgi:hypothetical protein